MEFLTRYHKAMHDPPDNRRDHQDSREGNDPGRKPVFHPDTEQAGFHPNRQYAGNQGHQTGHKPREQEPKDQKLKALRNKGLHAVQTRVTR